MLLPARGQNGLHLLGPLIDRLIPREPGLGREPGHGLNQLIHLRIEEHLSITSLDNFNLVRRAGVPILDRDIVRGAMDREPQVVGLSADDKIQRVDAGIVEQPIGRPTVVLHQILPLATAKHEGIVVASTRHRIVPRPTEQLVVARATIQRIGAVATVEQVMTTPGIEDIVAKTAQERIGAAAPRHRIVPRPAQQLVVARATIQRIGAVAAVADE